MNLQIDTTDKEITTLMLTNVTTRPLPARRGMLRSWYYVACRYGECIAFDAGRSMLSLKK